MRLPITSLAARRARRRRARGDRTGSRVRARRRHGLHRDQRRGERRPGVRPGLRRHADARRHLPHGRRGTGAAGLGSQGALAIERGWLLAVNAGSNDVSAFRIRDGHLVLVNRVPSGGTTPNSVTIHDGVAYVLNAGGTGNISGFSSAAGLSPLAGSTQPLSSATAGAVQVSFTPRGDQLVVSEKGANRSRPSRSTAGAAPRRAPRTPRRARRRSASRSASTTRSSSPRPARARSPRTQLDPFAPITASLAERSGRGLLGRLHEQRPLHVHRRRGDGRDLGLRQAWNGTLSLVTPGGATAQLAAGTHPLDEAISHDRFLYVNGGNTGPINAFKIGGNGSLTPLGSVGGLPAGFGGLVVGS